MDAEKKKSIDEKLKSRVEYLEKFQENFIYYILAIDAACIGFAINFSKDSTLSWSLLPLAISIILWGISFYNGIRELQSKELRLSLD